MDDEATAVLCDLAVRRQSRLPAQLVPFVPSRHVVTLPVCAFLHLPSPVNIVSPPAWQRTHNRHSA